MRISDWSSDVCSSDLFAEGETAWRLISHLSLNYLSLTDTDARQGAAALREILTLYADTGEAPVRKQIEGVRSVAASPVIRRLDGGGPAAVARGLEVTVTLDEDRKSTRLNSSH